MTTPLPNQLTATAAAAAIREGRLTSLQLVDACLERIAEREPQVGAWQHLDPEAAREQARRLDAAPATGLLHGVPIGIKDIIDTADMPTALGSPIYAARQPMADAACVALLRRAGAVILGKTVTTEFAYFHPGKTRNPRALDHTPGGSSSGSAAAVADDMVPAALGTQTAGSVTRPASFCGVVGYKPTFGDFALTGAMPFAPSLDTLGTLTRCVDDARLLRAALLGQSALPTVHELSKPLRIGLARTSAWGQADESTRAGVERTLERLGRAGAEVGEVELPSIESELVDIQKTVMAYEAAFGRAFEYDRHRAAISQPLRELIETGMGLSLDEYRFAVEKTQRCQIEFASLFVAWDLLLTPAARGEAPAGHDATGDPLFARIWTLLGRPTVTLPAFEGPQGLPVGVQLVGPRAQDDLLLTTARELEALLAA